MKPASSNPAGSIIIIDDDSSSDEEAKSNGRRRRGESLQACRYREAATRAKMPPRKVPPPGVLLGNVNAEAIQLTLKLQNGNRRDRSTKEIKLWCRERTVASTAVTKFLGKYYLDMKLIRSRERLRFAKACVACLHPYHGNRPTFDICDAMWRMLRALELDLEMSAASGVAEVFKYWHDEKIYCRHVRGIAMEVEKRIVNMHGVGGGKGEDTRG
ncbi:hypothetical protein L873DRAFT_1821970 [Choiromyces venosus 120613-1]|uniref:Uncharacterized protein n=1 Tax=Choiromyces venosus 120613-1 TaxID=1336337 RepID=A0A3N4J7U9_9PEZI|nr:hypothetical protein L873DRAFT_1821970 [Choiromyces venosus 120613-1]